jgi:hypothetical protein
MAIWFGALNGLVRVGTVGRAHQQWLGGCSSLVIALLSLMSHLAFAEDSGPLVGDLKFADPRLDTCIKTYAAEQGYRSAADVKEVPCFGLGIQSLNGIEALTEALVVDVSVNQIADFTPLYSLAAKIAYIDIHANRILCSDMLVLSRVLNRASIPRTALPKLEDRRVQRQSRSNLRAGCPPRSRSHSRLPLRGFQAMNLSEVLSPQIAVAVTKGGSIGAVWPLTPSSFW